MLLCDIGNTSYHFLDSSVDYKKHVDTFKPQSIQEKVYYICVNARVSKLLESLVNWIDLSAFVNKNDYYETMGVDRIFACNAIDDGVIIDAGSAITVDVVSNGVFEGGFIYPGATAMSKAYKNISPALEYPFNYDIVLNKLPKNSQDAISYGFLKTLYSEVVSHKKKIYLTGGDAQMLSCVFKEATVDEALIFKGMKKILRKLV
ncbi:MAG: pantothenate kinase [Sulfurimonas sp.]|nr:MAG: pantothenate kinase [Sulfurimonas sp.]